MYVDIEISNVLILINIFYFLFPLFFLILVVIGIVDTL